MGGNALTPGMTSSDHISNRSPRSLFIILSGPAVMLVGILVLTGWMLDYGPLKSIYPGWVSMKPNTAVGLILSGLALVLLAAGKNSPRVRLWAALPAVATGLLGALTLLQYFTGVEFGIDQLLFRDVVMPMHTSHPGRMVPTTAFCFMLVAGAFLSASLPIRDKLRMSLLMALGVSVAAMGAFALLGYSLELLYGFHWWNYTGMAVHTALSFLTLGIGLVLWIWPDSNQHWALERWTSCGFALGIILMLCAAAVAYNFTSQLLRTSNSVSHRQEILREFQEISTRIADFESSQRGYLITGEEKMLDGWEENKQGLKEDFGDVTRLTSDNPEQKRRLLRLVQVAGERNAWQESTIRTRKLEGPTAAARLVATGTGVRQAAELKAILGEMQREEYNLLDRDRLEAETTSTTAFLLMPLGVFLSLTLLSIGLFFLNTGMMERLQAERQLQASMREVMDLKTALDVHAIVSITSPGRIITHVNDKFCTISKFSRGELVGHDHDLINSHYHPDAFFRNLWNTIEQGKVWTGEIRHRAKDGTLYWVATTIVPFLDEQRKIRQYVSIGADVTKRKQAEEEIHLLNLELEERVRHRTSELESANKELEAFSYSVSHDLRAPLRTVDGFSQAVVEDYGALLPEEGRRYLKTIREGAQKMGNLIDDLLTFSRLSRLPLGRQSVSMDKLVSNVLQELQPLLEGRRIDIRTAKLPDGTGDPALLKQVWMNLLSNALKYTRKQENATVEIGSIAGKKGPTWFVRDNGIGFSMQYAHKLFGVFQRLHREDEYEGTGVGLAIVQRVVHRHGGRTWAEAEENRGATFYFNLHGEDNQ